MESNGYEGLKLENQLCFPLYACARQIMNRYTPYLKPLGLTYTQYIVMLVLWEKDGVTVGEIGRRLLLDTGTVTPLLKKLEGEGYIRRIRNRQDERIVEIVLTDSGKELREKARDIPGKIGGCISLEPEEAKALYVILYKLIGEFGGKAE